MVNSQSTWVLTSKNSPTNSNDTFDQVDTHVGVNPWSKCWSNPTQTQVTLDIFQNFCRILQNSPKHLKIYLYGSCPAFWGTQLSFRLAFQILSEKRWKTCPKVSTSCSLQLSAYRVDKLAEQNLLRKTPYSLCESCRWVWDLQLSYSTFGALLYNILEIFHFKQGTGKTIWAPPRCDVARARSPRAALGRPPTEARSSPYAASRGRWNPPGARVQRTALYRLGARRGPPVRRRRPTVRTPVEAAYHGRISAVTLSSPRPSRLY
jgi:hypothetical protein